MLDASNFVGVVFSPALLAWFLHKNLLSTSENYPYSVNIRWNNEFEQHVHTLHMYMYFSGCKLLMIFMKIFTVLKLVQSALALSWTWCESPKVMLC